MPHRKEKIYIKPNVNNTYNNNNNTNKNVSVPTYVKDAYVKKVYLFNFGY